MFVIGMNLKLNKKDNKVIATDSYRGIEIELK